MFTLLLFFLGLLAVEWLTRAITSALPFTDSISPFGALIRLLGLDFFMLRLGIPPNALYLAAILAAILTAAKLWASKTH